MYLSATKNQKMDFISFSRKNWEWGGSHFSDNFLFKVFFWGRLCKKNMLMQIELEIK